MPWKNTDPMDQKLKLIVDRITNEYGISNLARKYHVSRRIVHKWIKRYAEEGVDGLKERSRAQDRMQTA